MISSVSLVSHHQQCALSPQLSTQKISSKHGTAVKKKNIIMQNESRLRNGESMVALHWRFLES
jgi:hypothetical protein